MDFTKLTDLIGIGAEADVYRVGNYAVKLFKNHCPKQQAFYEALIHTVIESTKLPIPKLHQVLNIDGRWAIIMDMVEGITMKDVIYNDLKNLNKYIDEVVDLQIKIHQIEIGELNKLNEKLISKISAASLLNSDQKQKLIQSIQSYESDNKLCHGDFHFSNLIKTNKGITIIDWIDAASGSPEADICRTYLLYLLYANELADLYLDAYCRKACKKREDIIKWLPIIAGARLCENKQEEVETLMKIVNKSI